MIRRTWFLYVFFILLAAAVALNSCSKNAVDDGDDGDDIDDTPPAAIADLRAGNVTTSTAVLQWTAPGDDGTDGIAREFDMRGSMDSITEQNFDSAYRVDDAPAPLPSGMTHTYNLDNLDPGQKYYFAIKSSDEMSNWSAISNCASFTTLEDMEVNFPDPILDSLIREEINMPTGQIHKSDLVGITDFSPTDEGITDLTGIENCVSLTWLDLFANDISDVTPLKDMTWLVVLYLQTNNISNIDSLVRLTNLEMFAIGQNPVSDISVLAGMTKLHQLRLNDVDVTDFLPIYGLPLLNEIDLGSNWLGDITFVSNLTQAEYLGLYGNNLTDISPLENLTALIDLNLAANKIQNLTPLTGLTNISALNLRYNEISDISPLLDNTGLGTGDELWLNDNPLSDYSIDSIIPKLEARGVIVNYDEEGK